MSIIYEHLKLYHPSVAKNIVDWREVNSLELCITLDDGRTAIYDEIDKTIRYLPVDSNNMTEEECKNEFGIRLRKIMLRRNMTQLELSEKTGISCSVLSGYMTGRICPSFYKVDKIAKVLDCSLDELRYI